MNEPDVEFFWDPICPWAWITSQWVREVAAQRDLVVDWRFIALRIVNEEKDYDGDFADHGVGHGIGRALLRVAAAVRASEGRQPMGALYERFGSDIHVHQRRGELAAELDTGLEGYLRSVGVAEEYRAAAGDASWDEVLRVDTGDALARTGPDVGTPIITFNAGAGPRSFFGPVMNRVPRGEEALVLWDAIWTVAGVEGFAELKRSLRGGPQVAS